MKWLLQGATPLSPGSGSGTIDVLIDDDRIAAVGAHIDRAKHDIEQILPAHEMLVMPGLVNAHLHSHDRFDKGRFDNMPLEIWRSIYNPPMVNRAWTPRETYLRTVLNGIELLRGGTTTVIDDVHHGRSLTSDNVDAVFQAYADLGLRALVSVAFSDAPFYVDIPFLSGLLPETLKTSDSEGAIRSADILDLWRTLASRYSGGLVRFVLSPSAPDRCSPGFLRAVWNMSEDLDLPVLVHALETKVQALSSQFLHGDSIIAYLRQEGLLTQKTVLAHCVWVTPNDIDLIAASRASVVHCPGSNLKLGSGVAPIARMLDSGIPVGIGTDNNSANDASSMVEQLKLTALIHKRPESDYRSWIGAQEAISMATVGGARCAQLGDAIGFIEPGQKADFVLFDLTSTPFVPRNDLANQLVFAGCAESIRMVAVDGRIVMQDGQVKTVDEPAILSEIAERMPDIRRKILEGEASGNALRPYLEEAYRQCVSFVG